jgi:hypothetical protein
MRCCKKWRFIITRQKFKLLHPLLHGQIQERFGKDRQSTVEEATVAWKVRIAKEQKNMSCTYARKWPSRGSHQEQLYGFNLHCFFAIMRKHIHLYQFMQTCEGRSKLLWRQHFWTLKATNCFNEMLSILRSRINHHQYP